MKVRGKSPGEPEQANRQECAFYTTEVEPAFRCRFYPTIIFGSQVILNYAQDSSENNANTDR